MPIFMTMNFIEHRFLLLFITATKIEKTENQPT